MARALTCFWLPTCLNTEDTKLHPRVCNDRVSAIDTLARTAIPPDYSTHPEVWEDQLVTCMLHAWHAYCHAMQDVLVHVPVSLTNTTSLLICK